MIGRLSQEIVVGIVTVLVIIYNIYLEINDVGRLDFLMSNCLRIL